MALKYEETLKQFLELRKWSDELILDEDNGKIVLSTGVNIEGQNGRAFIEAYNDDIIQFYFYYLNFRIKDSKFEQMNILLSLINSRLLIGCLKMVGEPQDRMVRWQHVVDFEGADPTGVTIERNFQAGWSALERYIEPVSAVALTKQSATDAINDHDAEVKRVEAEELTSLSSNNAGVPDEL